MAPKLKKAETEENPFLTPLFDLDRIHLADKDHLIVDTKCEFDFADLQSWLKDIFFIPEWWNWTLGIKPSPVFFPPASPFPRIRPQMPGPLHSRPESHSIFIRRKSIFYYAWSHWSDDADTQRWILLPFQSWRHHRTIPETIIPPKRSDFWAFSPTGCLAPQDKSPVSFLLILNEGKSGHIVALCSAEVFFGSMVGWTHIGFSAHFLHQWETHHSIRLKYFPGGKYSWIILKFFHRGHVSVFLNTGLHVHFLSRG